MGVRCSSQLVTRGGRQVFGTRPHTPPQIRSQLPRSPNSLPSRNGLHICPRCCHPHCTTPGPVLGIDRSSQAARMTDSIDYINICESCPPGDGWGPSVTTETTLDGVPYAPFSKGDKLGRMADWTSEGKDRERGRNQYNRNYRGKKKFLCLIILFCHGRRRSVASVAREYGLRPMV